MKVVTPQMFCAQGTNSSGEITDACKGDSGGPIVGHNFNKTRATLVGVISKGEGCARMGYPGIYTHLAKLRGWVDKCVNNPDDTHCS
jgi:secreted trypsin-like serine protease